MGSGAASRSAIIGQEGCFALGPWAGLHQMLWASSTTKTKLAPGASHTFSLDCSSCFIWSLSVRGTAKAKQLCYVGARFEYSSVARKSKARWCELSHSYRARLTSRVFTLALHRHGEYEKCHTACCTVWKELRLRALLVQP